MPSKPQPKTFIAKRKFSCAGSHFEVGDVVPPSVALDAALRHGDEFVEPKRSNRSEPVDSGPSETSPE